MKRIISVLSLILVCTIVYSQAPESFSYQTVIRNSSWNVLANQNVGIEISILEDFANGTVVYKETHNTTTNNIGLVNLAVGEGNIISGDFSLIDWGNHSFFIEVAVDISGGANYQVMGTTQLRSVPYALYAKNSGNPGPQGPIGLTGPQGPQGVPGDTGALGPQGPIGLTGPQGPAGNDGVDGVDGAVGPQGPAGNDGVDGVDGAVGPQGPQGPAGNNGVDGVDGAIGPQGPQGPAGNDGVDGVDGAVGPQGPQGPAGNNGVDGVDGAVGPQGPQGPAGNDGINGNGIVNTTDNGDGTFTFTYSDGSNFTTSNLTGPQGNTGADGLVDSNYIDSLVLYYSNSSATSLGGCNFLTPEGLSGDPITYYQSNGTNSYVVPTGKKLYILSISSGSLWIDGVSVSSSSIMYNPNIAGSGQTVQLSSNVAGFNGFLVDENPDISTVTYYQNTGANSYVVPTGKKLYILSISSGSLWIDGVSVSSSSIMYNPNIAGSGQTVQCSSNGAGFNAYLVDENYFDNCGGGSSASTIVDSNTIATIDSLSQVVSSLDSTLTAITSLFVFGCMDTAAFNYNPSANINDGSCTYTPSIGDTYQGGIIFYLDGNGGGLIAAPTDQSFGASEWGCMGTNIGTGSAIGSGAQNTAMIELGCTTPYTAADVCANLTLNGYSDWFLPSRMELVEMHQNIGQGNALGLGNIGGFSNSYYWSSSEAFGSSTSWAKYFGSTTSGVNYLDKDELEYVRAIRAF